MPLKKTSGERRANLPRKSDYAKIFTKDWDRLNKAGKVDMHRLKEVMALIVANDAPLGVEWSDHDLSGKEWKGCREWHVGGDFLLAYELKDDGSVVFVRTGTHSELFG